MSGELTERAIAIALAGKILDRVNADPDDDLAILARQLLRTNEALTALPREGNAELVKRLDELQETVRALLGDDNAAVLAEAAEALSRSDAGRVLPAQPENDKEPQ